MKQKNWLRSILLLGSALMLFFSCNTANDPKDDGKATEKITLTYAVEGGNNGTLEVKYGDPLADAPASGGQIAKGSKVVFTATPKTGFKVKAWTGITASPADAKSVTVAKADSDLNVKVTFEAVTEKITLTYGVEGGNNGTLEVKYGDPLADAPASGGQIAKGSKVVFTATPKTGFKVKAWTGITASPADAKSVTVAKADSDLNVKVTFEAIPALTTVTLTPSEVKKGTGNEEAKKERNFSFTVQYPEFTLPNPDEYIDTLITLEGDKPFPENTKITLTYTNTPKGGTAQAKAPVEYTVTGAAVTKICGSEIFKMARGKLQAGYIEAKEECKIKLELPTTATEATYNTIVKVGLFADANTKDIKTTLANTTFNITGYDK
ncbi:MAG: InlB B-repeat-containing protein [Treponema sp.]